MDAAATFTEMRGFPKTWTRRTRGYASSPPAARLYLRSSPPLLPPTTPNSLERTFHTALGDDGVVPPGNKAGLENVERADVLGPVVVGIQKAERVLDNSLDDACVVD